MTANTATAGQRITAAWLNTNIPGAWSSITPLNSWAVAGGQVFEARLHDSATVHVRAILTAGTLTAGTAVGQLPAGMIPSNLNYLNAVITSGTGLGGNCFFSVSSAGVIGVASTIGAGATQVALNFLIPLDS